MGNTIIKSDVSVRCRKDGALLQKIADVTGKHFATVARWFYTNSPALIRIDILDVIKEHTGLTEDEILITEDATA